MAVPNSNEDLAEIVRRGASHPMRKWVVIAILIALAGAGTWYFIKHHENRDDGPHFVTQAVKRGNIKLVVTAAGNLQPTNLIIVGSELSGIVKAIYVDTNDQVKKGQKLLELDPSKLEEQIKHNKALLLAAKAKVSQAKATLEESRSSLDRQEELLKLSGGRTPSKATMDTARATLDRAKADLESANANVAGAVADVGALETDLSKLIIRSPVDGVVLTRTIEIGQTVAASFTAPTLFTIAEDLRKMDLVVEVSEADIGQVKAGQSANFTVDAWPGREYEAKVKKVSFGSTDESAASGSNKSTSSGGVVTYDTELEVNNEDLSLRPGMTATVDISIANKKNIIIVPNAALRFDPQYALSINQPKKSSNTIVQSLAGRHRWRRTPPRKPGSVDTQPHVWILKEGKPAEIKVQTGITDGFYTEITDESVQPGTKVITSLNPMKTDE